MMNKCIVLPYSVVLFYFNRVCTRSRIILKSLSGNGNWISLLQISHRNASDYSAVCRITRNGNIPVNINRIGLSNFGD